MHRSILSRFLRHLRTAAVRTLPGLIRSASENHHPKTAEGEYFQDVFGERGRGTFQVPFQNPGNTRSSVLWLKTNITMAQLVFASNKRHCNVSRQSPEFQLFPGIPPKSPATPHPLSPQKILKISSRRFLLSTVFHRLPQSKTLFHTRSMDGCPAEGQPPPPQGAAPSGRVLPDCPANCRSEGTAQPKRCAV